MGYARLRVTLLTEATTNSMREAPAASVTPAALAAARRFGVGGRFELLAHERRLMVEGQPAALGARAFDLLLALVDQAGLLLTKSILLDRIWPGQVVQENNLAAQVSALRKVLGGDLIATIPGRGYRFTGRPVASGAAWPGEPTAAPPPATEATDPGQAPTHAAQRTNLPDQLTPLIGRDADLAALGVLVPAHRLITLVGAGGLGKTRLAQAFLQRQRDAWQHGVCWVDLAAVADPQALPDAIAAALGLRSAAGEPLSALCAAVAPLQLLVVLDNAEHQLAPISRVTQALLDAAPGLHLIVTSQAPLGLAAERVVRLDALAVPPGPLPADQALRFGAVELFTERAKGVDRYFVLTDANAPAVIALCAALDGLALAIELAAARVHLLGVQRLLAAMQDRLRLLTRNPNRDAPARQQTLRATLEWSHDLLDPAEQTVFRRLAVMAGSASLSLVQQVVADPPEAAPAPAGALDEWAVIDALDVLVERCLVTLLGVEGGTEPRYRLLESSRLFALERLQAAGEAEPLRARLARALAQQFDAQWTERCSGRIGMQAWEQQIGPDADNAREAIAWAVQAQQPVMALTIATTWLQAIPFSLHRERMALADTCDTLNTPAVPIALRQRVALAQARTWTNSRKHRGIAAAEQALSLARALDAGAPDRWPLYRALCQWVEVGAGLGDTDPALLAAAMAEVQALEDPAWPAIRRLAGANAKMLLLSHPDLAGQTATEYLRAAHQIDAIARAAGDIPTSQLGNLVDAQLRAGDPQAAIRTGQLLLAHLDGSRNDSSLAYARLNLGASLLAVDDTLQARPLLQAGWQQAMAFELQPCYADYLALLAALGGRYPAAARLAGYADAANRATGDNRGANESAAITRARALARAALGEGVFAQLLAEGESLRDSQIAALVFGEPDEAPDRLAPY